MMENKIFYSWIDFDLDIKILSEKVIVYKDLIKNIYGVPRGGLVVAIVLSHYLKKPIILEKKRITSKTLIVNDISDTGNTLSKLLMKRTYFMVLTLFKKNGTIFNPEYYVREKLPDSWIVFPWELEIKNHGI